MRVKYKPLMRSSQRNLGGDTIFENRKVVNRTFENKFVHKLVAEFSVLNQLHIFEPLV